MNIDKQRRQKENASLAKEAHLGEGGAPIFALLDDLHVGMIVYGPQGQVLALNQALCDLMGTTQERMLGKTSRDWEIFDTQGELISYEERFVPRVLATRQPIHNEVLSFIRPDTGERGWLLIHMQPFLTPSGEIDRIFATATDITAQTQTEEILRQRENDARDFEKQLKTLHEVSLLLSQSDSPDTLCRRAIELGRERFGFDRLSLWLIADDPDVLQGTYGTDESGCLRAEHSQKMRSTTTSRQTLFADSVVQAEADWPLCNERGERFGRGWHLMASLRDGTNIIGVLNADNYLRHQPLRSYQVELLGLYGATVGHLYACLQKEKNLRKSEERFSAAVTGSNDGLYDIDLPTGNIYFSPRFLELLGYLDHAEELPAHISAFEQWLHPDDKARVLQSIQESIFRTMPFHAEYRLRCRNGEYRWFQSRGDVQCDALGQPRRLAGFLTDITASKRQILLMEQTNRAAHIGGWEYDVATKSFYWTEETYRIHEIDSTDYIPTLEEIDAFYAPESALRLRQVMDRALAAGEGFDLDLEMVTAKGRPITVKIICNALIDTGKVIKLFGALQDITTSKQAEMAQRESQARFHAIFTEAAVGIALVDMNAHPVVSNPALQEMLGYNEEELRGMTFVEFTHPEDIALDWSQYQELIAGRQDSYQIEKRYLRKDGRVIWVRLTVSLVRNDRGEPQFGIGMAENITERKIAEQNLQDSLERLHTLTSHLQSVREEERTRVAREVHDELGQALTGLKIELAWLKRHMGQQKEAVPATALLEKMDSMNGLIETTIKSVRRIATELRPAILDTFGLVPALEWQTQDFQKRTGVLCTFFSELDTLVLDQERTTAVFRIAQESLTNVLRHAKATKAHIRLEQQDEMLILTVQDNGIGIGEKNLKAPPSFGLLGMRERALLLGGQLRISGVPKKGTTIQLRLPIKSRQETSVSALQKAVGM